MKNPFEIANDLFDVFMASTELTCALGIPEGATIDVYDGKIRRVSADATLLDVNEQDVFPFIDYSWIPASGQQKNMLTFKGVLEFNIWSAQMYSADAIYVALKKIIKDNYGDSDMIYAAAVPSGIPNIYRFRFRMNLLIES